MSDNFYRSFEERYYAPRTVIKDLRRQYLPLIEPLVYLYPGAQTYDAGCGRGEWLELMIEKGFNPVGVDLDQGMLAACKEHGLPGEQGDAIEYIRHFGDGSLVVASAFHVVEHISFDDLRTFVSEAFRALKPGGVLIMETPNPENIVVATRNFYLDPTHQKPIPSGLLAFVAEFAGFQRVKTMRLQEARGLVGKADISIADLLGGVSPDYAIVAQKSADPEVMATFDEAFEGEYGLSLETLTARFDHRFNEIETKAGEAEARAGEAEARAAEAVANIEAILNSRSWRLTAPIRALNGSMARIYQPGIRGRLKLFLQHASLYIQRRPRLKNLVLNVLKQFPETKARLIRIAKQPMGDKFSNVAENPLELANLSPRVRQIYHDLKVAIERTKEQR